MSESLRRALGGLRLDDAMVLFEHVDQATYRCTVPVGGMDLPVLVGALPGNPGVEPGNPNLSDRELITVAWLVVSAQDLDPVALSADGSGPSTAMATALNSANAAPGATWALAPSVGVGAAGLTTADFEAAGPSLWCHASVFTEVASAEVVTALLQQSRFCVHHRGDLLARLCRLGPWTYRQWSWTDRAPDGSRLSTLQARRRFETGQPLHLLVGDPLRPTTVLEVLEGGTRLRTSFLDATLRPWLRYEYDSVEGAGEAEQAQAMVLATSTMHTYYDAGPLPSPVASALAASRGAPPPHKARQQAHDQQFQPQASTTYRLDADGSYVTTRALFTREGLLTDRQISRGRLGPEALSAAQLPPLEFGAWHPYLRRQG